MNYRDSDRLELQDLRYFVEVASHEDCSISDVAKQLGMAQSNLSASIKNLEKKLSLRDNKKKLEVALFNRKKRPLQLTTVGQEFFQEAISILSAIDRAFENAQQRSEGKVGQVTVALTSSVSNSILPDILRKFREQYPHVKLIWREMTTHNQLQALRSHQIDVGLLHLPKSAIEDKELGFTTVLEEPLIIVLPENHQLARTKQIPLKELQGEKFILPDRQLVPGLSQEILDLCKKVGFEPKVTQEAALMLTILGLVAGEVGIALLPANAKNLRRKGVVYRKIEEKATTVKINMAWRRSDESAVVEQFRKVVREIG